MRLLRSPRLATVLLVVIYICAFHTTSAIDIPLEVLGHINIVQLPTITAQSPSTLIAFPFDESFPVICEAKGNPEPEFRWTKNDQEFDPFLDPRLMKEENSGTFVIPNNGNLTEYQGTYRCYASNKLGIAISKEIEFIVPNVPKFPKETLDPVVVEEGQPFTLKCDPPNGIPPLQIYWMTINLQHIEQDQRVSVGLNGDLYFSHAVEKDSRRDYCCFASFPRIRTIVQKTAMSVIVKTSRSNAILERKPSLLTPPGGKSEIQLVKGEDLNLECIAEGFPTPQVEWKKMGHKFPSKVRFENHGKLVIVPRAEQEDSGNYMCKAKNPLGEVQHTFTVTVEEPPEWVFEPESQLSMIGSDVHIKCSASGIPQPTTTWRVNGGPLVIGDTIVIHNAQVSDSAVYQCEASNRHGTILSNANIMIMSKYISDEGEEYSVVERKGVTMHCKQRAVDLNDSPESVHGPRFTVHENGSLKIYNVERGDTGQYTCLAKNTEGSSAINAMLYVKVVAPEDQRILIGTTAQLSCLADPADLIPAEKPFSFRKSIPRLHVSTDRYFVENGVFHIMNVSHSDQGVYRCVAKTPADQDVASALLMVLDVPDAPENLVLSDRKGRNVTLKWVPGDDHNSSTTEFIIEYEESHWEPSNWKELLRVPGNRNSAELRLNGNVDYCFRVSAVNAVGTGRPSEATERYKTPPEAPDRNPENIRIEGHLPHEMDIKWEPLLPIEHNGPSLEYKVSYRRQDVEEDWKEHTVKRHSFVVRNTPTFVPYEIKIQAKNRQGFGPEPKLVTGYSGEDFPSAAPDNVAVKVMNSSVVKVSWTRVHKDKLHGHLGGYRISWWRLRSLVDSKKSPGDKHTLTVPGDKNHATVPSLTPFSEYSLIVMTFNGRGNGPGSHPVNFKTPEGVPEKNHDFRVTDVQRHTVSLAWKPPLEPNGILIGYLLKYQLINDTEEVGPLQTVDISKPETTTWILRDLEPLSKYKFYLCSCTAVGCGPDVSDECTTTLETRISTKGWFIGLMCAIALLTLIVLIACFVNRNKGGKYSVKEKEDLHPDVESQGMNDDTFCEYSDNDEKPLKGSQHSLSREIKAVESGDSLVDYGDEDAQFNEDGSFIGEYAGRKEKRASAEIKATIQTPA
uniref:Neural cell adhesion molecule L1-like protein n=1 Tax=Oreochromis niloticus TaxID=8128 RepID=A0A669AUT2_ORENI